MKRVFSVLVVVLLVAVLAVPVFAAESYDFYFNDIAVLPDFVTTNDTVEFFYDGVFHSGRYHIYLDIGSDGILDYGEYDIMMHLNDPDIDGELFYYCVINISAEFMGQSIINELQLASFPDESLSAAVLSSVGSDPINYYDYVVLRFVPVAEPLDSVLASVDMLSYCIGIGVQLITGNWFTALLLCLSLIGLGAVAVKKLKRAK